MFARIGGMSNEANTQEYLEGWEAALEGKRRAPYPKMSYPYKCWWKGHLDAQERKRTLLRQSEETAFLVDLEKRRGVTDTENT